MPQEMKYVYLFREVEEVEERCGGSWDAVRSLLGGKGANLADMTRIGISVPPGFIITTDACLDFLADGSMSEAVWQQALDAVRALEKLTESRLGDSASPLMISCRSGAKISMPGMMDTILNIGLNDEVAQSLIDRGRDSRFIYDCYRRLVQMFGNVVLGLDDEVFERLIDSRRRQAGVADDADLKAEGWKALVGRFKQVIRAHTDQDFPSDPYDQLRMATEAVFKSWNSKRAIDYRNASRIPHDMGTAVNIQAMVFGNRGWDSGTGVAFSRNPSTGERSLYGEYLANAQGEDIVSGARTPKPIEELANDMPKLHWELTAASELLERHHHDLQDIEF
ncbi:MAG: PEP/pyruvate-binding domain-containing protein, partial [Acidobacteriota bacterium]